MTPAERRHDRLLAALLGVGLAALYWAGRSRSFGPGDSAQHVLCALLWAVPQPPGYPLQTALGWFWSRLPWADPGAAVNGLSGLFHAAAASVLFLLLRRSGCRRAAALTGAGLLALSPLYWYYSLVAEVRALNDLLALLAAWYAGAWARDGRERSLRLFAIVFGLGLSHHPTFILLAPAYAIWICSRRCSLKSALTSAVLVFAALVAPYLILGLRLSHSAPVHNMFEVKGWSDLLPLYTRKNLGGPLRMVAGNGFLGFGALDFGRLWLHTHWFLLSLWTHVGPVGLLLAAAGATASWKKERRELLAWSLWTALSAGVFIAVSSQQLMICDVAYARGVVTRFHLLPMLPLFFLAGRGAQALAQRVRPLLSACLASAVILIPLSLRPLSLSQENALLDYTRALVRDSRPGDLIVLAADDSIFAALDLELVRGETGGRVFVFPSMFSLPAYIRSFHRRYPDVRLPAIGPKGLPTDWEEWKRLNSGRRVLLEPSLRDTALSLYPHSVPQGTLIRVESRAMPSDPAADARRFLDFPETGSVTRWTLRPWTQEVYVLEARRRMAEWLASRLDVHRDRLLLARLHVLLASLQPLP